jgi:uncharacterized protein DUF1570
MGKHRLRDVRWWAVVVMMCCACPVAVPQVPSKGGPPWIELTSKHFVVWTDASIEDGRKLIRMMENLRQILFGVSVFNPTSDAKAIVIAMRSQREVDPYVRRDILAMAWPPEFPLYQPAILLSVDGLDYDRRIVTHELTHVISYGALPVHPRWFGEGLASYFETLQLDEDGSFELGAPFTSWLRLLRQPGGGASVATLFACTESRCGDAPFYATSWALFSYLTNRRPDDLLRYIQRLLELPKDDQASAWPEVFPDLTPDKLDRILDDWIRTGDLTVHRYKIKLKDFAVTQRLLGDGEVYTARALLRYVTGGRREAEVAAALSADPDNVIANMINMDRVAKPNVTVAHRLTVAHPDDWRAWWLHKHLTEDRDEAKRDMAQVCALVARTPAILPRHTCPTALPPR